MSAEVESGPVHIPKDHPWAHAWKIAAVCAVLGSALAGFGWYVDAHRFAFSWLFAFVTFVTLAVGAIFFVAIQFLTVASWSVTVRRTAEFFAAGTPVFAVLFIPLALPSTVGTLYEWHAHAADHGAEEEHGDEAHGDAGSLLGVSVAQAQPARPDEAHGEAGAGGAAVHDPGAHTPQHALHGELLEHKHGWLNYDLWLIRALAYIAIWIFLGVWLFRSSVTQDRTKDFAITRRLQKWSPGVIVVFAATLTFAMFDWVMSLEPTWYSTIYGVYIFAGTAVSIHALVTVITLGLKSRGLLGDTVNVEHYHDLGKMTFGFIVFWAYIGFGQMMLQWYANIPEEIIYYHHRWHADGWKGFSLFLLFGYFVMPFLFLISRNIKRRLPLLGFACTWLLVMHVVDTYWFVMPNVNRGALSIHWIDLAALLAVGGIYFTVVLYGMKRHALIPVGDPRLERALSFINQ